MASPNDDKSKASCRGQKRNFSFESHPKLNDIAKSAKELDNFDIATLVSEIERTVKNGSSNYEKCDTSSSVQGDSEDGFCMEDDTNNNDGLVNEVTGSRGSYIPYPMGVKYFSPVDLQVTNLDQTLDQREMKKIILTLFSEHVNVLNVSVFFQSDGNMAACVRVSSPQDAQIAIAQLHRKKMGYKRIMISYHHGQNINPSVLRSKVASLLREVPNGRLQLFKFREMYEKRYHDSIGVSDLYKMKDLVTITEDAAGRMIQLVPNWAVTSGQYRMHNEFNVNAAAFYPSKRGQSALPQQTGSSQISNAQAGGPELLDSPYCTIHCVDVSCGKIGWAEKENGAQLPNVSIALSVLGQNLKQLIQSHYGVLPLGSLTACYAAEYPPGFQIDNDDGVPLEHLVTCVRGIAIHQSVSGIKQLVVVGVTPPSQGYISSGRIDDAKMGGSAFSGGLRQLPGSALIPSAGSSASSSQTNISNLGLTSQQGPLQHLATAGPLASQLALFSRELIELLKTSSGCRMPFSKFIPAYHHRFERQCRVADYGYTKLKDLFEALPHVVQIMGEGSKAVITLAHRAQVKRFTNDLLKVLKGQPSKQLSVLELPLTFEKTLGRTFKISDYGVCELEDILNEVSETAVVLSGAGDEMMVSVPKREQTQSEVERTHQFAQECVELLKHAPDCRISFNKFIPAYHHHFSRQCRVSDYGFTKLAELFEAIPNTVEITEDADGERMLQLTDQERLAVLEDQITSLIVHCGNSTMASVNNNNNNIAKSSNKQCLNLEDLDEAYISQFGYQLRPDTYGETSVVGILKNKLSQSFCIEEDDTGCQQVRLIDRSYIKVLAEQVREILASEVEGSTPVKELAKKYQEKHGTALDLDQVRSDLSDWVEFLRPDSKSTDIELVGEPEMDVVKLKPLQLCIVKIQNLLKDYQDKILMSDFEAAFAEKYGTPLCPGQFGYPSLMALMQSQLMKDEHFLIRGRGARKMIWFMRNMPMTNGLRTTGDAINRFGNLFPSQSSCRHEFPSRGQGKNWTSGLVSVPSRSLPINCSRALRNAQFQPVNRNQFVYPPPVQNPYPVPMPPPPPPGHFQQPPDYPSSYWGNLAQFGLFPNGRGGVGPAGQYPLPLMEPPTTRPQNQAIGSNICGRSVNGGLIPPPPLPRITPVGSPVDQGISSLLPTPHSPSPMMNAGNSPFMFPPTYWPNPLSSPGPFTFK